MISKYIDILEWIFQFGLLSVLATTIIFARRLEAVLRQVRNDHDQLQAILHQIEGSTATATAATERLMQEAADAESMLQAACHTASAATRKLDDLIGQANLVRSAPPIEPVPLDQTSPSRTVAARKTAKPLSRGERDLARILLDAG